MKQGIHPKYFPNATVVCACGNTWQTGSTTEMIHTDVCSKCHPFYTGEQRIVDTEGQVDRFYKKLQARQEYLTEVEVVGSCAQGVFLSFRQQARGIEFRGGILKPVQVPQGVTQVVAYSCLEARVFRAQAGFKRLPEDRLSLAVFLAII